MYCDESKSELARDLGDRGQSQNVPYGTSGEIFKVNATLLEKGKCNTYSSSKELLFFRFCVRYVGICKLIGKNTHAK